MMSVTISRNLKIMKYMDLIVNAVFTGKGLQGHFQAIIQAFQMNSEELVSQYWSQGTWGGRLGF